MIATKDKMRVVAAVDCEEFTSAPNNALINLVLKRIGAALNPTAEKLAAQSPSEALDNLLERGWSFELKEQFNEARILVQGVQDGEK